MQMLLIPIGVTQYNVLSASVSPKISPELTFAELVKASEEHVCPKKNVIGLQHKFLLTYQGGNQTI